MASNPRYSPRSAIINNTSPLFRLPSLVTSFPCSNNFSKSKLKRLSSSDILRIPHFQSYLSRETS